MWVPIMPLHAVLFPGMPMPLAVFEERYLGMIRERMGSGEPFGIALIRRGPEVGGIAEPYEVGTTAQIVQAVETGLGLHVVVVGQERFRIAELAADGDLLRAQITILPSSAPQERVSPELCSELAQMLCDHVKTVLSLMGLPVGELEVPQEPERLSYMIAAHLTVPLRTRQALLELGSVAERLMQERDLLRSETEQYRLLLLSRERAEQVQATPRERSPFVSLN